MTLEELLKLKESLVTIPPTENSRKRLGVIVARWTTWTGNHIFEVFLAALTEANFLDKAAIVQSWLEEN